MVTSPFLENTGFSPVFIRRKHPVPYVFFASPPVKQVCPKSAACWSPAAPAMGILPPKNPGSVYPYTQLEGFGSGSMEAGIFNSRKISSSQVNVLMLNSMVRDALE